MRIKNRNNVKWNKTYLTKIKKIKAVILFFFKSKFQNKITLKNFKKSSKNPLKKKLEND